MRFAGHVLKEMVKVIKVLVVVLVEIAQLMEWGVQHMAK